MSDLPGTLRQDNIDMALQLTYSHLWPRKLRNGFAVSVVENLLIVQEHDSRIRDMKKEMRDIPARKEKKESRLNDHRKAIAEAEERLKATLVETKKFEVEAESGREKIAKLRRQQLGIKTNKEFKAMETEIKIIEDNVSGLEDQELEFMEAVDKGRADVARRHEDLKSEEAALRSEVQELEKRVSGIEAELKRVQEAREAAAQKVEAEWLAVYEKISKRKDKALVPIEGNVCDGCHVRLPPYAIHEAKKRTVMVTCNFCGRLLY